MPLTKATQNVVEGIVSTGSTGVSAGSFIVGQQYKITSLGTTTQSQWNTIAGTTGQTYVVGSLFTAATIGTGSGNGAAAVARTLANRFADVVNVKDFGAVGDGVADDTAAIQAAVAASDGRSIYIPYGTYKITNTINFSGKHIFSDSAARLDSSTNVVLAGSTTNPAFYSNNRGILEGFSITGNLLAPLIRIDSTNETVIRDMFLNLGFNLIDILGTSFYITIDNCRFYECAGSWVSGVSATNPGFDLFISNCRGTSSNAYNQQYGFYFQGLGSLIMSDCQFAPCFAQVACFAVATLAPLAGVQMISNTVFENYTNGPSVYLRCTALNPAKFFQFSNCYIGGGSPAAQIDYGISNIFTNTYFTGNGNGFVAINNVEHTMFDGCQFQVLNLPFTADIAITKVSASFTDCVYTGGFQFVYLPFLAPSKINYITARGGYLGSNSIPIDLPSRNIKQDVSVFGQNYGPIQNAIYTGTLNASGVAAIAHGIADGNSKIVSTSAYWKGGSAEAYPLTITSIDGTNVNITGGLPAQNANYRLFVEYVQETVAW